MEVALGALAHAVRHARRDRRRDRADAGGQHPALRRRARPEERRAGHPRERRRRSASTCRGRRSPPRSAPSRGRPPRRSRRSSPTRSPTTPTRSSPTSSAGSRPSSTATLVDIGAPYPHVRRAPRADLSRRRGRRQPRRLHGHRRRPARRHRAEPERLPARARTARSSFQKGKDGVVIPGTEAQQPAVDGGTLQLTINRDLQWYLQQLIGEQVQDMGAQRGTIIGRRGRDRQDPRRRRVPDGRPQRRRRVRGRRTATAASSRDTFEPGSTFKALTAATVHRRRRPDPAVHRRRVRAGRTSRTARG